MNDATVRDLDLSVLIVSHGHDEFLPACVASVARALAADGVRAEILLLDNIAPRDLTPLPDTLPVVLGRRTNDRPQGLSANVNRLAAAARGRRVLMLNPDTEFLGGSFGDALAYMDAHPGVGVLGARLVYPDGTLQPSYRQFPSPPQLLARGLGADNWPWQPRFYRQRMMAEVALDRPTEVDWLFGAFMLFDAESLHRLGGFDEGFRLYYEDVDICRRFRRAGLSTVYFPALRFTHKHMRASAKRPFSQMWRWHVASALRYFAKAAVQPLPR
ncbi:MAG: glycosyltransferase family 2 protein [Rhizobacter sp.]|nr:glycosyltransferase family 2 protein [Rhizobacter sp.]